MASSEIEREEARPHRFVQVGPSAGFMTFWTVASLVWTTVWLLIEGLLGPAGIGIGAPYLVAIGVTTGLMPPAVLLCGRAILRAGIRLERALRASIALRTLTARGDRETVRSCIEDMTHDKEIGRSKHADTGGPPAPLDRDSIGSGSHRTAR